MKLSLTGDLLAIAAAGLWALYSILTKMIGNFGYSVIQSTRRTFFFGILFMLPVIWRMGFDVQPSDMFQTTNLLNLVFLGFGASALCFVTWNYPVRSLGSVKTSVYIYAVPVITTVTSGLILKESVTPAAVCGIALTLAGLLPVSYTHLSVCNPVDAGGILGRQGCDYTHAIRSQCRHGF